MAPALTSFQKRVISAIIIAPVVLWMIIAGGIPLVILVLICAGVSLFEWVQLSLRTPRKTLLIAVGIAYVGLSFWACYSIRSYHALPLSVLFIMMVWSSDIGAYFTGKFFKGPKMAPRISPNKTWAGLSGAALFPGLLGVLFSLLYTQIFTNGQAHSLLLDEKTPACIFLIGALTGVIGQLGDLMISALKRYAGAKDSGTLIPGHGGLLDRVDSLMLAAIFFWMILHLYPEIAYV